MVCSQPEFSMADPGLQRLLLDSVLSLPPPVLRALSGGGAVQEGGRTLDPRFQYLRTRLRRPTFSDLRPEAARAYWARLVRGLGAKPVPGVEMQTLEIDGAAGPRPARLFRPDNPCPQAPLLLFLHEGGGVVGEPELSAGLLSRLAHVGRCPVIAPAYRLAPEHRFPAGLEDSIAAYDWAEANAERLGATGAAVAGQSIGAAFAAAICQSLKAQGRSQPRLQLLICPILDASGGCQSLLTFSDSWPLSRESFAWTLGQYLGPEDDPCDPRISPFRAEDVSGLAPAVIVTAGFDPVVDQGELYARKLRAAGVPVIYRCYDHLPHGFSAFAGVAPSAETACSEIGGLLREGLEGRLAGACTVEDRTEGRRSLVL
jgi:acetyl esterase/lipase